MEHIVTAIFWIITLVGIMLVGGSGLPETDFTKSMIIGVFSLVFGTGGVYIMYTHGD